MYFKWFSVDALNVFEKQRNENMSYNENMFEGSVDHPFISNAYCRKRKRTNIDIDGSVYII